MLNLFIIILLLMQEEDLQDNDRDHEEGIKR